MFEISNTSFCNVSAKEKLKKVLWKLILNLYHLPHGDDLIE
jgi:hypothetical protein